MASIRYDECRYFINHPSIYRTHVIIIIIYRRITKQTLRINLDKIKGFVKEVRKKNGELTAINFAVFGFCDASIGD